MYFSDVKHKENFNSLLSRFPEYKRNSSEYLPTIYVASFPDIFKFVSLNKVDGNLSAIHQLVRFKDEKLYFNETGLTDGTKSLIRLALSCFNGLTIDISSIIGNATSESYAKVLLQTIKIRMRYEINI